MTDRMQNAVAIIGVAGRFPGAGNVGRFWQKLCASRDSNQAPVQRSPRAMRRLPKVGILLAFSLKYQHDPFTIGDLGMEDGKAATVISVGSMLPRMNLLRREEEPSRKER